METQDYFCTYCNEFLLHMEVLMACPHCNEYKGIITLTRKEN